MRALLFTKGSPFARAIRILLDELDLEYERREAVAAPSPEEAAGTSPTLQVPTLWDGNATLWDSSVIADYLFSTYPNPERHPVPLADRIARSGSEWDDRLLLASVQTLGTSITFISQMTWTGVTVCENAHLSRCAERLPTVLGWLEERLSPTDGFFPGRLSAQDIFLACHLRFAEKRPLGLDLALAAFPRVAALLDRLDSRPSFSRNPIPWWEPGVVGYADDGVTPLFGEADRGG